MSTREMNGHLSFQRTGKPCFSYLMGEGMGGFDVYTYLVGQEQMELRGP